ncbi:hypothetical protein IKN40_09110 [bacterium]|nr:hypothetical protein [bacterium]
MWNNIPTKSTELDSVSKNFAKDLMLPFAGYRNYSDAVVKSQGNNGGYRSSSRNPNGNAYNFNFYGGNYNFNIQNDSYSSNGYSIRCFKNTSEKSKKLTFLTET